MDKLTTSARISPKTEALAFRIWRLCEEDGWDYTPKQIATKLGVKTASVTAALRMKGWLNRLPEPNYKSNPDCVFAYRFAQQHRSIDVQEHPPEISF